MTSNIEFASSTTMLAPDQQTEVLDILNKLILEGAIANVRLHFKTVHFTSHKKPNGYAVDYHTVLTKWAPKVLGF